MSADRMGVGPRLQKCHTCLFWIEHVETDGVPGQYGSCHLNPAEPLPVVMQPFGRPAEDWEHWSWPITPALGSCSQGVPKP